MSLQDRIDQAVATVAPRLKTCPRVALILGSGLGGLADAVDAHLSLDYGDIPHFKESDAPGHAGRLVFGELAGQQVVCMQGRLHAYEGNSAEDIVFPLRVMNALGAQTLVVTNAAGAVNTDFEVADLMLITDHINLMGSHPLTLGEDQGLRDFTDMTYAYTAALREQALAAAHACGLTLRQGVYIGVRGPSFETPAEIRAFRVWGADAVGMSTVFEVIAAASLGMDVLGLSFITNMAAGVLDQPISGEEVLEASKVAIENMKALVLGVLAG
ncbi:MAG: purine-nucleoside phosphorylase [Coriobacteriales bacterium]|jgi:purine-nucleoside phosphorylase|nr:purine-nucleoside phosphorylase [Coriobacteriales bacterium]